MGLVPDKGHVVVLAHEVLSHQVLEIPELTSTPISPPADAITPVAPVGVDTHRPELQTLNENSSGSSGEGQKSFRNLSKRNRDTAAGDGWAINISLSAGGMRVSDSEPRIVTANLCRFWIAASNSPLIARGTTSSRLRADAKHSAPSDRLSSLVREHAPSLSCARVGSEFTPKTTGPRGSSDDREVDEVRTTKDRAVAAHRDE